MRFPILAIALVWLGSALAQSHVVSPEACQPPVRPPDKQDADRWNTFVDAVDAYRACISDYVTHNREAAAGHDAAAQRAAQAWNEFVRDSLNAPEDYPWPPE